MLHTSSSSSGMVDIVIEPARRRHVALSMLAALSNVSISSELQCAAMLGAESRHRAANARLAPPADTCLLRLKIECLNRSGTSWARDGSSTAEFASQQLNLQISMHTVNWILSWSAHVSTVLKTCIAQKKYA